MTHRFFIAKNHRVISERMIVDESGLSQKNHRILYKFKACFGVSLRAFLKPPEFIQCSELLADFAFDLWSSASLSLFKRELSLLKMS